MLDLVLSALFSALGLATKLSGLSREEDQRVAAAMKRVSLSAVREAQEGQTAKIAGRVRARGATLRAPFTGRECVLSARIAARPLVVTPGGLHHRAQGSPGPLAPALGPGYRAPPKALAEMARWSRDSRSHRR